MNSWIQVCKIYKMLVYSFLVRGRLYISYLAYKRHTYSIPCVFYIWLHELLVFSMVLEYSVDYGRQWRPLHERCEDLHCHETNNPEPSQFDARLYDRYVHVHLRHMQVSAT